MRNSTDGKNAHQSLIPVSSNMTETVPHHPETEHGPEHSHSPKNPEGVWQWLTRNVKEQVSKLLGWGGHGHGNDHGHAQHGHDAHKTVEPKHEKPAGHDSQGSKEDDAKVIEKLKKLSSKEAKLEEGELKGVELLIEKFKPELKYILYPCCATHSLKKTFPDSQVTYVDIDERSINAHKKAGHDAHAMSALDFKPAHDPDLLVLFNQNLKKEEIHKVAGHVKPGKYVLCNDYHHAAEAMMRHPDFEFVGIVEKVGTFDGRTGENKLVTENLEKYFKKKEGKPVPFQRNFEAGGIDDYYFFRRKNTQSRPANAHRQAA